MTLEAGSASARLCEVSWDDTAIWKGFFDFQSVLSAELRLLQGHLNIHGCDVQLRTISQLDGVSANEANEIVQQTLLELTLESPSLENTGLRELRPEFPSLKNTGLSTSHEEGAQVDQEPPALPKQPKSRKRSKSSTTSSNGSDSKKEDLGSATSGIGSDTKKEDVEPNSQLMQFQTEPQANSGNASGLIKADESPTARLNSLTERLKTTLDHKAIAARAGQALLGMRSKSAGEAYTMLDMVDNPVFSAAVATMILFNSVLIAIEVEWMTQSTTSPAWVKTLGYLCTAFFCVELFMRMLAEKRLFFTDQRGAFWWNVFDSLLVLQSISEVIVLSSVGEEAAAISSMASVKLLKLVRIFRVFRVFRFFRQLTKLALMIIEAFRDLFWAVIMIVFVVYLFAVMLTMRGTDWLKLQVDTNNPDWPHLLSNSTAPNVAVVHEHYGSLARTLYTLLQVALGGISWGEVCTPLIGADPLAVVFLLLYINFILLAVLNVITGTFVDEACRSAEKQRDLKIQEEKSRKEEHLKQFTDFFESLDANGSGEVAPEELEEMLQDETLSAYFRILGFDIDDAGRFIRLLDADCSGAVSIDEFLDGCMRFRGPAQGVDVHHIIAEVRMLRHMLAEQFGAQEQTVRKKMGLSAGLPPKVP